LALLIAFVMAAFAAPVPARAQAKIGVVDMERAMSTCKQGKRAKAELKRKADKLESELKAMGQVVQRLRKDLENTAMLLKPEAKLKKEREFERKLRAFQDRQRDAREEMMQAQRKAVNPIGKKMVSVIRKLGVKHGYTLITSKQTVIYAPDSADITDQVIAAYDKAHP
jgi:outer membrane protein